MSHEEAIIVLFGKEYIQLSFKKMCVCMYIYIIIYICVLLTLRGRMGARSPSLVMPGITIIIRLGPFMPKTFVS